MVEAATHMPREEAVTCHLALFGMATPAVTCTALLPKCTAVATLCTRTRTPHHTTSQGRRGYPCTPNTYAYTTPTPHTYTYTY